MRGTKALTEEFWNLLKSLPRNGRFSGIQPTKSGILSTQKMGVAEVIRINDYIKKHEIIVEAVLEEDFIHQLLVRHGKEWLKSFIDRAAYTVVVPDEYVQYLADIYLTRTQAVLVNWDTEIGVVISNKDIVDLLQSMFRFMHDSGRRISNADRGKLLLDTL